jgi:hypothetical protein
MRNTLLSLFWAVVGGVTAFVLGCCLGDLSLTAILSSLGQEVTPVELNVMTGMAVVFSLLFGIWCKRLFYKAKLPGYQPDK